MKSGSVLRGIALGLLVLRLVLVVPAAYAGEDTIKIGILHSLSGTMAILAVPYALNRHSTNFF